MPDHRTHRGPHPEDHRLFASANHPMLREAVGDLSWLLTRGYSDKSALKLVGDRYRLLERQRMAVMRCACSDASLADRAGRRMTVDEMAGARLLLDGYNVLTTVEVALAGGIVIAGRDGCFRDMASMHGTFRKVTETVPALELTGEVLSLFGVRSCTWYLDRPVSNSGRLKQAIAAVAVARGWEWDIELVLDPDTTLSRAEDVVASADSVVLDRCGRWCNLAKEVIVTRLPGTEIVDLCPRSS